MTDKNADDIRIQLDRTRLRDDISFYLSAYIGEPFTEENKEKMIAALNQVISNRRDSNMK